MVQRYFNTDKLFDSHCHLYSEIDINTTISNGKEQDIEFVCDIAIDIESSKQSINNSKSENYIKSFVGIDPEVYVPKVNRVEDIFTTKPEFYIAELKKLLSDNLDNIFGIGEIGIDNYWLTKLNFDTDLKQKSLKFQEYLFRSQLQIASEYDLPVSLHSRGAESLCLKIVKEYTCFGIFHSFTGSYEEAKSVLDAGWGLGINGIITYKNAIDLREVYRKLLGKIPTLTSPSWFYDKGIYFETDSPYLSPEPLRGAKNQPANIKIIWEAMTKCF
jgi:TatD DNase family protein